MTDRDIQQLAEDIVNKLMAYKEPLIRESVFSEKIKEISTDILMGVIMYVIRMAYHKEKNYIEIVSLFTNKTLLKEALGEKGMYELTSLAVRKEFKEFLIFLVNNRALLSNRETDEPLPDPATEGMPLGWRKALSKSHNRSVIEKLLYDTHPAVISGLLNNPRITEMDIVKIVSKRPNSEEILRTVYNHERWKHRYTIQCSLVMNPYTPSDIALPILPELFSFDLLKILRDSRLSDVIRSQAKIILTQNMAL